MPKRIAIVVRRPDLAETIAARLKAAGAVVLAGEHGTDAMNFAQDGSADLVVLDMHLEDEHGDQVCRDIKALPETRGCKVLMLIEDDDSWFRERCSDAGADAVLAYNQLGALTQVAGKLLNAERRVVVPGAEVAYYILADSRRTTHTAEVIDISVSGIALRAAQCELEPKFVIDVRLKLPGEPPFLARAEVVRVHQTAGGYAVHAKWQGFRTGDRERLAQVLACFAPAVPG